MSSLHHHLPQNWGQALNCLEPHFPLPWLYSEFTPIWRFLWARGSMSFIQFSPHTTSLRWVLISSPLYRQEKSSEKLEWKQEGYQSLLPLVTHYKVFASCSHNLRLCRHRCLGSRGRNASTRRYNTDPIELEVKTVKEPLWAHHTSELTGQTGTSLLAGVIDADHQGETGLQFHME